MSRAIYLSAMGPASGKSVVALGLVEVLSRRVGRVGFYRPIVSHLPDDDCELIRTRFDLPSERVGTAFTIADLGALANGSPEEIDAAMAHAVSIGKDLEARCDVLVIEGSDFGGPGSALEFDVNAGIARHLGAPVIAVVNGLGSTVGSALAAVQLAEESLAVRGDAVLAIIVNRVPPDVLAALVDRLAERSSDRPPAWAIPEIPALRAPTLGELGVALDAELLAGDASELDRQVLAVKVAAMSVPNLLDHIGPGTVLITPGDRADVIAVAALSRLSESVPAVVGLILTAGLRPDERITALVRGLPDGAHMVPMLAVATDTFETAALAADVEAKIAPGDERRAELAATTFGAHVDVEALADRVQVERSSVVTPVMFQHDLIERARATRTRIVLPEGDDDRILAAAERIARLEICVLTVLGAVDAVRRRSDALGLDLAGVDIVDPSSSPWTEEFAIAYAELRRHRGVTLDQARDAMADVAYFGTMMVHGGRADGMVSGAAHTTASTVRPALEIIRTKPGVSVVSSVFLMLLADRVLVYGDCAINPNPDAVQLADIAVSSAGTAEQFGIEPRVAMLSYSTGTSGSGADVDRVRAATERVRLLRPGLAVEGPIQYDAAIDAGVGRSKLPDSAVAGRATVFIFPDLNTGNNTYKAVQRSAGAVAIGPVLQGLNRPVNDLSRGATVTDIVNTVAITAVQAATEAR